MLWSLDGSMAPQSTRVEAVLAQLASTQHGVVTRTQLLRAGLTVDEIRHRLEVGALLREHSGVYRVGHRAPSIEARYLAAVLACGEEARLSGRAAAHLFGLLKGHVPAPEVTAPSKRAVNGVRVRRASIEPPDRATYHAIPVTAVPRTLIDLAADLPLSMKEGWLSRVGPACRARGRGSVGGCERCSSLYRVLGG